MLNVLATVYTVETIPSNILFVQTICRADNVDDEVLVFLLGSLHILPYLNSSHRFYNLLQFQKIKDAIELHNTARCSIGPPKGVGDLKLESSLVQKDRPSESASAQIFFNSSDCIKGRQSISSTPAQSRHHSTCILYISFLVKESHMLPICHILCHSCSESHVCI